MAHAMDAGIQREIRALAGNTVRKKSSLQGWAGRLLPSEVCFRRCRPFFEVYSECRRPVVSPHHIHISLPRWCIGCVCACTAVSSCFLLGSILVHVGAEPPATHSAGSRRCLPPPECVATEMDQHAPACLFRPLAGAGRGGEPFDWIIVLLSFLSPASLPAAAQASGLAEEIPSRCI